MASLIADAAPVATRPPRAGYAWYVLACLFTANAFNAMDRSIVTILIEPIKRDLALNDTQIGTITGLGYALVYALVGLLIAGTVNRGNRKNTLSLGIAFWSVMTVLTGYTTSFGTMLAARFGIAAGEATCYPTALSLIGDYVERPKRSRAIAIFHLGTYVGIIIGVSIAGVIAAQHGWRAAFHLLGVPGLVFAAIIWLTVKEPVRGMSEQAAGAVTEEISPLSGIAAMWRLLNSNRQFALLVWASIAMTVVQAVMGSWIGAFLMRVYNVGQGEIGIMVGPVIGLSGVVGTLVGGFLGTQIAQRNPEDELRPLRVVLASAPLAVPAMLLFLFAPTLKVALLGAGLSVFFIAIHFGPLMAVTIGLAGLQNRGVATSLLTAGQFLVGFGFGPLAVGAASDLLQPSFGIGSLRMAMLLAPAAAVLACCFAVAGYRWRLSGRSR